MEQFVLLALLPVVFGCVTEPPKRDYISLFSGIKQTLNFVYFSEIFRQECCLLFIKGEKNFNNMIKRDILR